MYPGAQTVTPTDGTSIGGLLTVAMETAGARSPSPQSSQHFPHGKWKLPALLLINFLVLSNPGP